MLSSPYAKKVNHVRAGERRDNAFEARWLGGRSRCGLASELLKKRLGSRLKIGGIIVGSPCACDKSLPKCILLVQWGVPSVPRRTKGRRRSRNPDPSRRPRLRSGDSTGRLIHSASREKDEPVHRPEMDFQRIIKDLCDVLELCKWPARRSGSLALISAYRSFPLIPVSKLSAAAVNSVRLTDSRIQYPSRRSLVFWKQQELSSQFRRSKRRHKFRPKRRTLGH